MSVDETNGEHQVLRHGTIGRVLATLVVRTIMHPWFYIGLILTAAIALFESRHTLTKVVVYSVAVTSQIWVYMLLYPCLTSAGVYHVMSANIDYHAGC